MSHSQEDVQRLPELVGYEVEVPEDFAAAVAERVEERTQIVILLEFVFVGLLLTVFGLFGMGGKPKSRGQGVDL